ncbi:HET-domain-containing protein [Karstenula rhodostoma CBS 690.94]|uniref:HET-domain-containing protein n=1 Tax=Karstenula rhodostoma CBS 690.94 TaxID=1392251 RepID=A0A9P4U4A7_9PLEO|nr:HET-domain-containing protein [Karstenula rhodostoma CBS 690.94]
MPAYRRTLHGMDRPSDTSAWHMQTIRYSGFYQWIQTARAGSPFDKLLCDVAGKLCSGQVPQIDFAKKADCDPSPESSFMEIRDHNGTKQRIDLHTDDAREYTFIHKVDYAIDRTFFRKTGIEGARTWLHHCLQNHSTCGSLNTCVSLPTRLVAVGSSTRNPYLYTSGSGEKGSYLALSYCWGKGESLKTTKNTLDQLKTGFVLESLPKTCQDAIVVARQLDVRYIWIDRLCIIQDDGDDWIQESASMYSVYANALLTLAALHSRGGDAGLYTYSTTHAFKNATAISEVELSSGRKGMVVARRYYNICEELPFIHGPPTTDEDPWPPAYLESRLWTLQEIALSRRVLWFARGELAWSCKEGTACECFPQPTSTNPDDLPSHIWSNLAPESQQDKKDWLPIWYRYIEEATQRLVKEETDRLPAVAGMASAMKHHIGRRYIAGHWEVDIEKSLLWMIEEEKEFRYESTAQLPPLKQYYAPSWSWASISRPLKHIVALIPDIVEGEMDCKVIGIEFWPSTSNINGPGLGIITMEAVIFAVSPPKVKRGRFEHKSEGKRLELLSGFTDEWIPDPRGNQQPTRDSDLYLAVHIRWPDDVGPNEVAVLYGLVLERVNEDEYKKWEAELQNIQAKTGLNEQETRESRAIRTKATEGNVYRRVGCLESWFRTQSWEELVEEYQRQIYII